MEKKKVIPNFSRRRSGHAKFGIIGFFILICVLVLIFLPGYSKYQVLVQKNAVLEKKIGQLEFSNEQLKEEKKKLEEDMVYVEKVLRDKLKVVKKGEIIYKVDEGTGE